MRDYRYEGGGHQVGGIGGTMDIDLHDSREQCIRCCNNEVGMLHNNSTANAQWAKKLIDLHEFQNVSISAKMWRLLPKVPYS